MTGNDNDTTRDHPQTIKSEPDARGSDAPALDDGWPNEDREDWPRQDKAEAACAKPASKRPISRYWLPAESDSPERTAMPAGIQRTERRGRRRARSGSRNPGPTIRCPNRPCPCS